MDRTAIPANAEKMQGNQKFQKGRSGNPKGKIKGTKNKATLVAEQLLQGELETICRRLIQEAVSGNMQAIKMILDRMLPPKRDCPIDIEFPQIQNPKDAMQAMSFIVEAVGKGNITPNQGESLSRIVDVYVKAIETYDCENRLSILEGKNQS